VWSISVGIVTHFAPKKTAAIEAYAITKGHAGERLIAVSPALEPVGVHQPGGAQERAHEAKAARARKLALDDANGRGGKEHRGENESLLEGECAGDQQQRRAPCRERGQRDRGTRSRLLAATGRSGGLKPAGGVVYAIDRLGHVHRVGNYAGPGGADELVIAPGRFGSVGGDALLTVDAGPHGGAVQVAASAAVRLRGRCRGGGCRRVRGALSRWTRMFRRRARSSRW